MYTITSEMQAIINEKAKSAKISGAKVSAIVADCLALIPAQKRAGRAVSADTIKAQEYLKTAQVGESFTAKAFADKMGISAPTATNALKAAMQAKRAVITGFESIPGKRGKPAAIWTIQASE